MKTLVLVAAIFAAGAPALAAPWTVSDDKGLLIHRMKAGPLQLMMVCDPYGAYVPPQVYMTVSKGAAKLETGELTVRRGDEAVSLKINGAAILASAGPGDWNKAVGWLMDGDAVDLTAGGKSASVPGSEPVQNPCLVK